MGEEYTWTLLFCNLSVSLNLFQNKKFREEQQIKKEQEEEDNNNKRTSCIAFLKIVESYFNLFGPYVSLISKFAASDCFCHI